MKIRIEGLGSDRDARAATEWVESSRISGLRIEREKAPTQEGTMGAELLPVIAAFAASPVIIELIKTLAIWISLRKPKNSIIITAENGRKIELNSETSFDAAFIKAALDITDK